MNRLPTEWSEQTIGSLVRFEGGSQPPKSSFRYSPAPGYIRLIQTRDYKTNRFATYIPEELARKFCTDHDIMIGRYGPPLFQIFRGLSGAYNVALMKAVPKRGVDREYLYYFLSQKNIAKYLESLSQRSGGQTGVEMDRLKAYPFPLPPLAEQRKIAAILGTWDEAIAQTEQLIAALQLRKKGLMQRLLTGQVRFPGFERPNKNLAEYPNDWQRIQIGSLGTTYNGLSGKTKSDFGRGAKYIPYKNIFGNSSVDTTWFDLVELGDGEKQNRVRFGDVFFTTSSETPDEVGMSSVLLSHIEDCYLNSFCFGFRLYNFDTLLPEYARYLMRSCVFRRQVFKLAQGATRYNLSKRELLKIELPLPSVEEQILIAEVLALADTELNTLEQSLSTLKQQKKGLMQRLLTGQIRVIVDEE